jgi:aryl sulfotransferase
MWGGFPPPFSSPEDAVDLCIDKKELTFDHARGWWNVRSEPNVLLVHFADLKTHPRATIERIASFLDVSVSDELMNVTLRKSTFDYMKNRVDTEHPEVYGCRNGRPGEPTFVSIVDHINKGNSDGADEFFTPQMEQKFRIAIEKYLGEYPDLIQWLETGGSYT